jgi:hypothetical protein
MNSPDEEAEYNSFQHFFKAQKNLIEKYTLELLSLQRDKIFHVQKEFETEALSGTVDIYEEQPSKGRTAIYEIFISKHIKKNQIWDLAFLAYVLKEAGEPLTKIYGVSLNNNYYYEGDKLNLSKLLQIEDLTLEIKKMFPRIKSNIDEALNFLASFDSNNNISNNCCKSKDCPALVKNYPDLQDKGSVLEFKNLEKTTLTELIQNKIFSLTEIPLKFIRTEKQKLQVKLAKEKTIHIRVTAMQNWLSSLKYPVYFLDYEAISPAIPVYPGTYTFQNIVFQYSLYKIEFPGAEANHYYFLPEDKTLPTPKLLESLCSNIKDDNGTILVWHDSFEKARNQEMAALYPEFSEKLMDINRRIKDMEKVFNSDGGLYIHPAFEGKSSLKVVFPVMRPELSAYSNLDISDGMSAAILWFRYLSGETELESTEIRRQLLEYCNMDTFAMLKLLEFLNSETFNN